MMTVCVDVCVVCVLLAHAFGVRLARVGCVWGRKDVLSGLSSCGCAGIAGRVAIGVRGRERSRVCAYRISGECCVPEPTGEGTWLASAVPFWREQQLQLVKAIFT